MSDTNFDPETGEILEQPPIPPAAQATTINGHGDVVIDNGPRVTPAPPQAPPPAAPAARPARTRRAPKKRASSRVPPPPDESRRDRFIRIATGRFNSVVTALRILRKIGRNQSSYEYGDQDLERIRSKLQEELDQTMVKLKREGPPQQIKLFD